MARGSGGREILSGTLFKRVQGRLKMVAYGAEQEAPGTTKNSDILYFLKKSYGKISGRLLSKVLKILKGSWREFILDPSKVLVDREIHAVDSFGRDRLRDAENIGTLEKLEKEYPEVLQMAYFREIGGTPKLKVLFGTFAS